MNVTEDVTESSSDNTIPLRASRREWIGLVVLIIPTLLIAMDLTVLHLAVPSISRDLKPTSSQLLWIIDIYGFLIAGSLITMGTLGDRVGRRKLLLVGAIAFGIASIAAAFSTSPNMLIATRAMLGIAGATLMPSTISLIRVMFRSPKQRTVAIGIWVSGFSIGTAVGPPIGGALLEFFWWGSVFLIAVPVMVVLLLIGPRLLPEYKDPKPGKIDLISAGMSLVAILAIIYGVKRIAESSVDALSLLTISAGVVLGLLFGIRQLRLVDPLVDLRLLRNPSFGAPLVVNTITVFAIFGVFVFLAQYLQLVAGLSPLEAGLWTLPGAVAFIVTSNLTPQLVTKIRAAYLIGGGLIFTAVGIGLLIGAGTDSLILIVISWTVMSAGMAPAFTLTMDLIIASVHPDRAGAAAALSETGVELGGALGIGVIGSIGIAVYRDRLTDGFGDLLTAEKSEAARDTLGGAVEIAGELPPEIGDVVLNVARASFVDGMQVVAIIASVLVVVAASIAVVMLRHLQPNTEHESEETVGAISTPIIEPDTGATAN